MPRTERCAINSANASSQADHFWTQERIETLIAGAREGLSAHQIAVKIGGGCSKNAVISKASRIGVRFPGYRARRLESLRARIADLQRQLSELEAAPIRVSHETSEARQ